MKIVQFSVNIGNYDPPRDDGMLVIEDVHIFRSDARNSRMPKILAHKFFDCDVSIYWDATQRNKTGLSSEQIVEQYLGDADMGATKAISVGEGCVYKELEAAKGRIISPFELKQLELQAAHYREIGVPENIGTLAGYQPTIRRHTPKVNAFFEAWWAEMCRWSYRDQCSFPVVLARHHNIKINWVDLGTLSHKTHSHGKKSFPRERVVS